VVPGSQLAQSPVFKQISLLRQHSPNLPLGRKQGVESEEHGLSLQVSWMQNFPGFWQQ
jgi:hypothetical protein